MGQYSFTMTSWFKLELKNSGMPLPVVEPTGKGKDEGDEKQRQCEAVRHAYLFFGGKERPEKDEDGQNERHNAETHWFLLSGSQILAFIWLPKRGKPTWEWLNYLRYV